MYLDDQIPINVRNLPASVCGNGMYSGPTAVDFSMLPSRQLVPRSEAKSLKQWEAQDLSKYYREIRRRDLQ